MRTTINNKPAEWTPEIEALWAEHVISKASEGETITDANYHTPRPWRNEYDRGTDRHGFVFVVQPGNHVCYWNEVKPQEAR